MSLPKFEAVSDLIHTRRTHKSFTGAPIPRVEIERLLELARWAPNHRLSEPWRFYVIEQPSIKKLMGFMHTEPSIGRTPDPEKGAAKLAKLFERLPQAGAIVMTTWRRNEFPEIDREDQWAAAAAVQNVLLGATAAGVGSYWSTSAPFAHAQTLRWCGIEPAQEGFLGCIWLGYPSGSPPVPPRSGTEFYVRWI
jgi:nitroreductase